MDPSVKTEAHPGMSVLVKLNKADKEKFAGYLNGAETLPGVVNQSFTNDVCNISVFAPNGVMQMYSLQLEDNIGEEYRNEQSRYVVYARALVN